MSVHLYFVWTFPNILTDLVQFCTSVPMYCVIYFMRSKISRLLLKITKFVPDY